MKKHPYLFNIFTIIFVAIVLMLPMFMNTYHVGHDSLYHITNILVLSEQFQAGQILSTPILAHIADGLGCGSQLFYPPFAIQLRHILPLIFFKEMFYLV